MTQLPISRWLHRLLPDDGPAQDGHDISARALRARQDAQRWLRARQEEHEQQLLARREHAVPERD